MAEKHLTVKDLAERLGVPVQTIYEWNSKGYPVCPHRLKLGRHVRYKLADVEAWERQHYAERGAA